MAQKINRGQAAIWIILAIILVASLLLFVLIKTDTQDVFEPTPSSEFSIESHLASCVQKEVNRATEIMFLQGGFIEPTNFKLFNRTTIEFICETRSYFEPCIQQHPVLIDEMESEIEKYITPGVESCFDSLQTFVNERGGAFEIEPQRARVTVELDYDTARVTLKKRATLDYKGEVRGFEEFEIAVTNPIYNLGVVALEIATQEGHYCYFETTGFTLSQQRYSVSRTVMSDQTKIYSIYDKRLKKIMQVAVRSCPLPEGMPG